MSSLFHSHTTRNALWYKALFMIRQNIPNAITGLRIVMLPHLFYSFTNQITGVSYFLFLFAIGTDILDGYIARRFGLVSKLGGYFDVTVDFLFISGMYLYFIVNGIYSIWILLIIISFFAQFVLSILYMKKTVYDPIGKYYGSLLFGGIGLTLLFPNQLTYDIVTYGIVISTLISLISRITFFILRRNNQ